KASGGELASPEQRHTLCEKEPTDKQLITGCRLGGDRVRRGASTFRHVIPPTVSARVRPGSYSCYGAVAPLRRGSWPRGVLQWPGSLAMPAIMHQDGVIGKAKDMPYAYTRCSPTITGARLLASATHLPSN